MNEPMGWNKSAPPSDGHEVLQVVNARNQPCGVARREEIHRRGLFLRSVHILLLNLKGELFLQKRSATKDTYPGYWDTSVGGHVLPGEFYEDAAQREMVEELGVSCVIEAVGDLAASEATGWEFVKVYEARHDGPIHPNPHEIAEGRFATPDALNRELHDPEARFTPSFREGFVLWRMSRKV
ncbi:MAG: NUDIX domain-containing protein [bacterium]